MKLLPESQIELLSKNNSTKVQEHELYSVDKLRNIQEPKFTITKNIV